MANAAVLMVAVPPESAALPSEMAPSKNSTVPLAAAGDTVAVIATDSPNADGFGEVATVVVVVAVFTSCGCTADVLALKSVAPA